MTDSELHGLIIAQIDQMAAAAGKTEDWDTAKSSCMEQILTGITAVLNKILKEHEEKILTLANKINEIIPPLDWTIISHPSDVQYIDPVVLAALKRPDKIITPLT
jgi:hypothetical protein